MQERDQHRALKALIRRDIADGRTLRQSLLAFRGAGGQLRTSTFASIYRSERRRLHDEPELWPPR